MHQWGFGGSSLGGVFSRAALLGMLSSHKSHLCTFHHLLWPGSCPGLILHGVDRRLRAQQGACEASWGLASETGTSLFLCHSKASHMAEPRDRVCGHTRVTWQRARAQGGEESEQIMQSTTGNFPLPLKHLSNHFTCSQHLVWAHLTNHASLSWHPSSSQLNHCRPTTLSNLSLAHSVHQA